METAEADPGEPILTSNSAEPKSSNKRKAGDMDEIIAQNCWTLSKRMCHGSGMAAQEDSGRYDYTLEG